MGLLLCCTVMKFRIAHAVVFRALRVLVEGDLDGLDSALMNWTPVVTHVAHVHSQYNASATCCRKQVCQNILNNACIRVLTAMRCSGLSLNPQPILLTCIAADQPPPGALPCCCGLLAAACCAATTKSWKSRTVSSTLQSSAPDNVLNVIGKGMHAGSWLRAGPSCGALWQSNHAML